MPNQGGQPEQDPAEADYWELRPLTLVRVHRRQRRSMFAPDRCHDEPPIPLKHVDVTRLTKTNLENFDEQSIEDVWDGSASDVRQLSDWWVGETVFYRFFKEPKGYRLVQGRMTRI